MSQPGSAQRRVAIGLAIGAFVLAAAALVVAIARRGGGGDDVVAAPKPKPVASEPIRRLDDKRAVVPRATADKLLADPSQLGAEVTQVPSGFTIATLPAGSPLVQLGFREGDTIRGVNGMEVSTPASALEIYSQLKSTTRFTIDLDRAGQPMQLTLEIR